VCTDNLALLYPYRSHARSNERNMQDRFSTHLFVCFRCQTKFLTCEISDFTPCAQSDILHIKYAEKIDDYGSGFSV